MISSGVNCPSVLISHCHGNANVRNAAKAFAESGQLAEFWTGVAWNPEFPIAKIIPGNFLRQLERRSLDPELRSALRLHPWRESLRLLSQILDLPSRSWRSLSSNACSEGLDRAVAQSLSSGKSKNIKTIYAYDHGALETFRAAGRRGLRRIYDLPIGYWRALEEVIRHERTAWPDWHALDPNHAFGGNEFLRKDDEIALADEIVVPSTFVYRTLTSHYDNLPPVKVIPFGAPMGRGPDSRLAIDNMDRPLRVLYAGSLSLRKGTPYLLKALSHFGKRIDSTVVGRMSGPCEPARRLLSGVNWIESLPHADLLSLMRASDVFVFPTLFEGFALVSLEAMSQGCALITTRSFGGEELIDHGRNGFLIPERSIDAIVDVIEQLDSDRTLLCGIRRSSMATAAQCTWDVYRQSIRNLVGNPRVA